MSEAARQVPVSGGHAKPQTFAAKAFAAPSAKGSLGPLTVARRSPRPQDVQIEILFCGVCHSDLHQARNEWEAFAPTVYPVVPGHEIVGRVVKAGSAVKKFKEGDIAAVGCLVDSCRVCSNCRAGDEQYCENGFTLTYNSEDKILGGVTYGGYSDSIVVDEAFVVKVPKSARSRGRRAAALRRHHDLLAAAPLESGQGQEGWNRWPRRPGAHGRQVRPCLWRAHGALYHFAEQDRGREAPRCR